ncbi:cell wall-associated NlpC family hydrolase [Clostridium algifaecis]|uniref:Cell wall-associated NlpC family hydrolase n=1 Tax=Clostridium algifaecis TaxID=1472040 RepID=A0ABS4KTH3_9CLOT|nr:C40 family peptidase [Clostridium algifaecis]MBP2033363.1 cell wall-associated NlpC family hydrolase [Clostridium algifaecis]
MLKKNIALIVMTLIISFPFNTFASPVSNTSDAITQNCNNLNDGIEAKIEKMDNDIETNMRILNGYNDNLKKLNNDITENKKDIEALDNNIKGLNDIVGKRLRNMYETNFGIEYLDFLLSSKNASDAFDRLDMSKTLIDYDKNNIKKLENNKQIREKSEKKLEKDKSDVSKLKNDISKKIEILKQQKQNEKKLLEVLNSSSSNSSKLKFTSDNNIVNYALSFLGVPYVWGGTTPSGFDCSGFVQYVYAHFGISIPRISQDQQNHGTAVKDRKDLQPGDLVFFGTPAYHVGMYIGDGKYVEAPHTGDVVKIAELYNYTSAMRVKN